MASALLCQECELELAKTDFEWGLCRDCASKVPGEAKACPSCGCPLVARIKGHSGWLWVLAMHESPVNYCPESGCDLEAEFHLALRAKKAGKR